MKARRQLVLAIVATDATFARAEVRGSAMWVGRCIHCNTRLCVGVDGALPSGVTIEHILPRAHGGDDDPHNLALACARCNFQKGWRHDARHRDDPRAREVIALLADRRRARWREPAERPGGA
jgi:5-methylcytosine-specific restriction endonuclease McrA